MELLNIGSAFPAKTANTRCSALFRATRQTVMKDPKEYSRS